MENERLFEKPTEDYLRVMTASPEVAIADPAVNTATILAAYAEAKAAQAEILALPELSVTGYSAADLFFSKHVQKNTTDALTALAEATVDGPAMVVGAPLVRDGMLFNCGVMLANGEVAGVVPKTYLPNYNEFYEKRWFTSGGHIKDETITIGEQTVPFGTDLLFEVNDTKVGIEVCEDAFAPIPPSAKHALAGAEVIINLSASNELIGKEAFRRQLIAGHAANFICAYVYASAGRGESNADVVYSGHQMVYELGKKLGEVAPFDEGTTLIDIDTAYIEHDRLVNKTFADQAVEYAGQQPHRTIPLRVPRPNDDTLQRTVSNEAFKPRSQAELDARCETLFNLMAYPLAQRLREGGSDGIVVGLSGGLDSTLALITATIAAEINGQGNDFIHTITMPGDASSERTQSNASKLAEALGTTHSVMPIGELSTQAMARIGHDTVTEDITYENTQARMRTLLLMNYANMIHGMVEGTGDMSEIAQGWCTYNGDHMSMYNPNTSIPKTLMRDLIIWYADNRADPVVKELLYDIVATPVSPELTGTGDLSQETEELIGPYKLHDFFLTEERRRGSAPEKIGYLATLAFKDEFTPNEIGDWLDSFFGRFTKNQWKREATPNGPKVGTVSLSPRGDLRMAPNTSRTWYK